MTRIALAGPSELVTRAGRLVADDGGSIVDVVVAAALTATCIDPGICAPGGGGFLTIDLVDSDPIVVDGYMAFPGLGFEGESRSKSVTMPYGGGVTTEVGPGSVAVPGAFAAFELATERYGSMPWQAVVEVVASVVEGGFPMSVPAHTYFSEGAREIFDDDPASRAALFPDGEILPPGDTILFDDLAESLRALGSQGSALFYRGEMGRVIVDDLAQRGSRLTMKDLMSYEAVVRRPLRAGLSEWVLSTNPPPAVGGAALAVAMDRIVNSDDVTDPLVWLDALRSSYRGSEKHLAGAEGSYEGAVTRMLQEAGHRSPSTIAVTAVDADGSAMAASFSAGYGSGVIASGTGILMNNSVGEIQLMPGGLAAEIPGRRMLSNMAPTVARSKESVVAVASPGATRITTALAITLARILAGDKLASAIEHPRLHPEGSYFDEVAAEPGLEVGHLDARLYPGLHMFFGGVAGTSLVDGHLDSHADSRRAGSAVLLD